MTCVPVVGCAVPIGLPGAGALGSGLGPSLGSGVVKDVESGIVGAIGSDLVGAADWLVGNVLGLITYTTTPQLTAAWFTREFVLMRSVVLVVVLPVLLVATVGAVLHQDLHRLGRIWGVGLPVSLFAGLFGAQLTEWALAATDALCQMVTGSGASGMTAQFVKAMSSGAIANAPMFVQAVVACLMIVGAVMVWLELVMRSAGVFVATFLMPLALVGYIWPATIGMARRAVEILASLLLSKFVVVASLSLGAAALASSGPASGSGAAAQLDVAMSGAAILLLAGFAPFALLRLAPVVEAAAIGHLEGMSRRPFQAASRTVTAVASAGTGPVMQSLMAMRSAMGSNPEMGEEEEPKWTLPWMQPNWFYDDPDDDDGGGGVGGNVGEGGRLASEPVRPDGPGGLEWAGPAGGGGGGGGGGLSVWSLDDDYDDDYDDSGDVQP